MGLLDFNDPEVAFGIGLLGGGSFGQAAQRGLLGAQQTQSAAEERRIRAIQSQAAALELQRAQRADRNEQGLLGLQSQYFQPGTPGRPSNADVNSALPESMRIGQLPAVAPTAPKFDVQGYTGAALSQGYMTPLAASQLQQAMAKESGIDKLNPGNYTPASLQRYAQTRNYGDLQPRDKLEFVEGVGVNPYDPANANRSIPNPNKPFQMDASGRMFPNLPYQQYEKDKASAGASRTSVNVNNKMGEGLAAQVGPMMRESSTAADAAGKQIDAANRIDSAMANGRLFTGPGANAKLAVAQIGNMMGVGGKTDEERLANTRSAMQGLAQLTLQGRKQMSGQGAITESESALAERAMSGDISLTPAEIRTLTASARRAGQHLQGEHNRKLDVMKRDPSLSQMAPFYDVVPPAQPVAAPGAGGMPGDISGLLNKYGGR